MFAAIRKFAKSWVAALIFVPLLLVFAVAGFQTDVFKTQTPTYVVKAGGRVISGAAYKREFDRYRQQLEQRYQQPITAEMAVSQGVDGRMVDEIALRESFNEWLDRMGLGASTTMIKDMLRKQPQFFDPVTGEFDQARFESVLRENGLTPPDFDRIANDSVRSNQFVAAAVSGLKAPRAYSALGSLFALEQRDLAYFVIDPAIIGPVATPTDAEIQAFIKQNAAQFTLPEFRAFTIVRFSAKDFESTVTVDPAEVQKQFDFQKDSLSKPELRTAVQIPAKDVGQAQAIIARLKDGEDPAAIAASLKVSAVTYDNKPRSAFFDPAIAAAAFGLPEGGVSGPVKGNFGLIVLKVTQVTPGQVATLAEHRAEIEAKVRGDLAGSKVSELSEAYEDAHEAGATLPEAARKAGAPIALVAPVTADGRGQDGKPVAGLSPQVLKAVYELPQGGESDILDAGQGDYFAVRVERIVPPAAPPLETIKPALVKQMILQRQADAMRARAEALLARVRKGESLETAAASAGAQVVHVDGMTRATMQQHQALGRELVGGAMGSKKGEPFTAKAPTFGIAVAVVTGIRPGDPQQVAQATEQGRDQFSQELFGDIGESARVYARTRLKTRSDKDRAKAALGIEPADGATDPAGKGQ